MAKKRKKFKSLFAFLLVFCPALTLVFISTRSCNHKFEKLEDYGPINMGVFEIYDPSTGSFKKMNIKDFEGDIVILNTLQATCPESCKIELWLFNQMIYKHIYENKHKKLKQVKVISFLTDLEGNSIKDEQSFSDVTKAIKTAQSDKNYDPTLWMLARGNVQEVYNIEHNGKNLILDSEKEYGKGSFLRYNLLLDKNAHLRMVLPGNKEGETRRFFQSISLLQKEYSLSYNEK